VSERERRTGSAEVKSELRAAAAASGSERLTTSSPRRQPILQVPITLEINPSRERDPSPTPNLPDAQTFLSSLEGEWTSEGVGGGEGHEEGGRGRRGVERGCEIAAASVRKIQS